MSNFPTVKWKVTADSLKTVPPLLQRASLRGRAADGGGPTTCVSQRAEGRRGLDTYPNPRTVCRCFCCSHKAARLNLREFVVHPTTMGQGIKGEKWEVQIVFLGRNDDVVMVTGYFRIQNLKATSSKPFFFFSFLWVK